MFDKFGIECDREEFFKNPIDVIALMMFDCKYGTTFSLDIEPNKIYKTWHETDFVYEKLRKYFTDQVVLILQNLTQYIRLENMYTQQKPY